MSRTFTIESVYRKNSKIRHDGGRFISSTPAGAARKAFSQVYRSLNAKGKISLVLNIRETTSGSNKKIYKYKVSKTNENKQIERDGTVIFYKYITKVKAL